MRLVKNYIFACACIVTSVDAYSQTVQQVIEAKKFLGNTHFPDEKGLKEKMDERAIAVERQRRERIEALQRLAGENTSALPNSSVTLVQQRYETYYGRNNERRRRTLCEYSDGRIVEYGDDCPLTIP